MPIKKVKFNDKKEFKRYNKESDNSDQSDNEKLSDEELSKKKSKHTLDSDEEDNTDKYELLNKDVLNDIGQEAKTSEFDHDIKLTPFNMKEELEEGNFDREGYYHWKSRDKDEVKDAWLDNINWTNINTFKKTQQSNKMETDKPKSSNENEEEEESENSESENESIYSNDDEKTQVEMFKKMLPFLKPGESILKSIKRLGNSSKSTGSSGSSSLSASQRWLKKKNQTEQTTTQVSEKAIQDKESLEKLTGYANHFIDKGFYDIYEETFESLDKKIKDYENRANLSDKKESFDIFADEVDEKELKTASTSDSNEKMNILQDTIVKWIYKITNTEDAKIFGPFTSQQMLEKSDTGEFKETGVWCRKVNDSTSTFYNSKRIDFDLYT